MTAKPDSNARGARTRVLQKAEAVVQKLDAARDALDELAAVEEAIIEATQELATVQEDRLDKLVKISEVGHGRAALRIECNLHDRRLHFGLGPEHAWRHLAHDLDVRLALHPSAQGAVILRPRLGDDSLRELELDRRHH